jgi:hypothetical protein
MKFKSAKRTFEELLEKYNRSPAGWNIAASNDERGYFDIIVSNPNEVWQVKIDSIYKPRPVGLGLKIGGMREARRIAPDRAPSFGFRPVPEGILEGLMHRPEGDMSPLLDEILKSKPRGINDVRSPLVASGPVHYGAKLELSRRQNELDFALRRNLKRRLFEEGMESEYG